MTVRTGEPDSVNEQCTEPTPVLMHICCAPDATVPVLRLREKGYEPIGFFYDPNIHPQEEYELRLAQARRLARIQGFDLLEGPYEPDHWLTATRGFAAEPEGGLRCSRCFGLLLDVAARKAQDLHARCYTTTLLISPHKDVRELERIGIEKGKLYGITFLPEAFRKRDGFRQSVRLSVEYELYRQNYCGCIYSKLESDKWHVEHPDGSSWKKGQKNGSTTNG